MMFMVQKRYEIDDRYISKVVIEGGKAVKRIYQSETEDKFFLRGVECKERKDNSITCISNTMSVYECEREVYSSSFKCKRIGGDKILRGKLIKSPFAPAKTPEF